VLAARTRELIAAEPEVAARARLRITVSAGAAEAGTRRLGPARVLIAVEPYAALADSVYTRGVQIEVSDHRRTPHPLHAIKSTSYAAGLWQRREARDPATFDVVQCNTAGGVAEGSFTNVFVVDGGGVLCTPSPTEGCLPGVTRAVVLELAQAAGIPCREGAVPAAALHAAPELFLTGSLCGIVPVGRVSGRPAALAVPGPVTRQLMAAYAARVRLECQQESIGAANDG
jgi:branched-subunit amino acid aminotransferase/4-amino-4-deoxychorismate lyase